MTIICYWSPHADFVRFESWLLALRPLRNGRHAYFLRLKQLSRRVCRVRSRKQFPVRTNIPVRTSKRKRFRVEMQRRYYSTSKRRLLQKDGRELRGGGGGIFYFPKDSRKIREQHKIVLLSAQSLIQCEARAKLGPCRCETLSASKCPASASKPSQQFATRFSMRPMLWDENVCDGVLKHSRTFKKLQTSEEW